MKRLFCLSILTLLVVLGALAHAGWLDAPRRRHDPLVSSSFQRWRQGFPSHWRACLLQR